MRDFIKINNEGNGEEARLYELLDDNKLILALRGDSYHDKIDQKIDGFLSALAYLDIEADVVYEWFGYIEDGLDLCNIEFDGEVVLITSDECEVEEY